MLCLHWRTVLHDGECKGRAWTMTLYKSWYWRIVIMRARNVPFGNPLLPHSFHFYLSQAPSDTIALTNHKTMHPSSVKIFPTFLRQIRDFSVFSDFHLTGCEIIVRFIISYDSPPYLSKAVKWEILMMGVTICMWKGPNSQLSDPETK